ncbi:MAG TPA: serine hydrolase domain-containing protein [Burkholderiaceae bacterium]
MKKPLHHVLAYTAALLLAAQAYAGPQSLGELGAKIVSATPPASGVVLTEIDAGGTAHTVVAGKAIAGPALQADSVFRTASNTKTYTAVAILRLWEEGALKLDDSIKTHIAPAYVKLLEADGYNTSRITVRHLLSHTSGMADHAQTKNFLDAIVGRPDTAWTRDSHLKALVDWTDPVAAPGVKFAYSDPGYQLLGHIVEQRTGQPLAQAVRRLLRLDELGLRSTYWENLEPAAPGIGQRAHQYMNGQDSYAWNPSFDLYGGGGLVATPEDMARFMFVLFEGKVFKQAATLEAMLAKQGLPEGSPYRLGVFEYDAGGVKAYGHHGFWGTVAFYVPSQRRALAFALTQQEAFKPSFQLLREHVGLTALK